MTIFLAITIPIVSLFAYVYIAGLMYRSCNRREACMFDRPWCSPNDSAVDATFWPVVILARVAIACWPVVRWPARVVWHLFVATWRSGAEPKAELPKAEVRKSS